MLKMRFPGGLKKAVTLSYDDGLFDDIRLMELMDKYGAKGTFNVSSGLYRKEGTQPDGGWPRMTKTEAFKEYKAHGVEIAVHGLVHRDFTRLTEAELNYEISADRANLEEQFGIIVRGAAYPYGSYSDAAVEALRKNGIKYCRTVCCREDFGMPEDWLRLFATAHHKNPRLMELAQKFVDTDTDDPRMFYLWGHTAEFRNDNNWEVIESFLKFMNGHREQLWFATNIEICEYHKAYLALEYSVSPETRMVYNPTAKEIWLAKGDWYRSDEVISVKPGETITY